jgi:hypothetical protein
MYNILFSFKMFAYALLISAMLPVSENCRGFRRNAPVMRQKNVVGTNRPIGKPRFSGPVLGGTMVRGFFSPASPCRFPGFMANAFHPRKMLFHKTAGAIGFESELDAKRNRIP